MLDRHNGRLQRIQGTWKQAWYASDNLSFVHLTTFEAPISLSLEHHRENAVLVVRPYDKRASLPKLKNNVTKLKSTQRSLWIVLQM